MAVNANATATATVPKLDEQKGLANLVKCLLSMYGNPAAHEPRLHRTATDKELLERLDHGRLGNGSRDPLNESNESVAVAWWHHD